MKVDQWSVSPLADQKLQVMQRNLRMLQGLLGAVVTAEFQQLVVKTCCLFIVKVVLLIVLLAVSGCDGRSVVGQTGQNVTLLCKYDIKYHGAVHVCWGKGEIPTYGCNNQLLSTNGHKVETSASSKYQLLGQLDQGDVSLTILNLTEEDAGRYGCRVQINGLFNDQKHHFDLRVKRVPTSWTPSEPQTSSERPAAAQTAADQLTTESLLTSAEHQQEGSMMSLALLLVVLVAAVGHSGHRDLNTSKSVIGPEPPVFTRRFWSQK
ncbi:hepatitis A virus cellular receptor 1 homolog [Xiphophorus hellerii]|uniref:hepatitis A virus cellular receptor 1 homolog n=1 Tax=Xiphophorus hellerii TaxID=8084 RepID=UPI0013B42150|nr:hepatitis A virus cellular receptor 1 homolog [Xiphophorus hellerii]